MENTNKIKCPNCTTEIDVNNIVHQKIEQEYKTKYQLKLKEEEQKYSEQTEKLQAEKEEFEQKKKRENELFQERLTSKLKEADDQFELKLKTERASIEQALKQKLQQESAEQIDIMKTELTEKSVQLKDFNRTKAEMEKLKREKEEMKDKIEADFQRKMNEQMNLEKERIRKVEHDRNELAIRELQKKLDDQVRLTEEMKRKQEQGSMQLQGEVQELAIEAWLAESFPLDTITEIKKGVRGGDCIQVVNTRSHSNCGSIYYESKRTKEFGKEWIEKFKNDIREKGCNIGVLVTDAMPADMERMGLRDGIWICSYEEFKGLCFVLRESIIEISTALASQENKGDKMHMLYDYLTSNEFRLQIEAIVEGFTQMQNDLTTERRAMEGIWKKREKQINKVLLNTNYMYSSVKGIAGSAIQSIKLLDLPESGTDGETNDELF